MANKKRKKQNVGPKLLSEKEFIRQKLRTIEMGKCWVSNEIEEIGEGAIYVSRNHKGGKVSFAAFLVDIFCLGVKNSFLRLRKEDYELMDMIDDRKMRECSYEEVHNWIYGAIAYAEEAGIAPHKSFATTRYMLEEDTDTIPLLDLEFGKNGKHMLIAKSESEASRYMPLLIKNLGEGNFHYLIQTGPDIYKGEDIY